MKKHIKTLKKKLKIYNPRLREECGIFGVSNAKDASALTALGLHALQHRGQGANKLCPSLAPGLAQWRLAYLTAPWARSGVLLARRRSQFEID